MTHLPPTRSPQCPQEPGTTHEQHHIEAVAAQVQPHIYTPAYSPSTAEDEWPEEPGAAPRPRRRLLSPVLALLGVLLIACGFIGGVLVEKGETSSSRAPAPAPR